MEGKGKRHGKDNNGSKVSKRSKVDHEAKQDTKVKQRKASVGRGHNVNDRHAKYLESLLALMSAKSRRVKITDDKAEVLERPRRSSRLYMEWAKKEDCYFLWGSTAQENLLIKFEFHGGFEASANELDVKKPLLVFSEAFDSGNGWKEVKLLLLKLFGHPGGEEIHENHDYMLAFTRSGDILHFRVFKLHSKARSDTKNLSLQEVSHSFSLKPLEMHRSAKIECVFLDEDRLMCESKSDVRLGSHDVSWDRSPHAVVPHILQLPDSPRVLLPVFHIKNEFLWFNTSCKEFFDRYLVSRKKNVPGTGPIPPSANGVHTPTPPAATPVSYEQITSPMKVFSRGLIVFVGEILRTRGCLSDFNEDNIFLRRGRVIILGVKILPYSKEQAEKNLRVVHDIILHKMEGMVIPPDVQAALDFLQSSPVENLSIIANNFAWMNPARRHTMVDVGHENFTDLTADIQVTITKNLPGLDKWLEKFANNWLLYTVITDKLPAKRTATVELFKGYMEWKSQDVQDKAVDVRDKLTDQSESSKLFNGRRYFKGIRNSYVHLPGTSKEKNLEELSDEKVDLVVSSEFAATCSYVQVHVPKAFKDIDEKRASYDSFSELFGSVDSIEFNSDDEKK